MRGSGKTQRVLAIIACLLWMLGVEALPAIHLAHHEADHTHDAAGTIVHHGDHDHVAPAPHHDADHEAQLAIDHPIDPGHQAAGVAHHAVALHNAAPPQLPPITLAVTHDEHAAPVTVAATRAVHTAARGPPARA